MCRGAHRTEPDQSVHSGTLTLRVRCRHATASPRLERARTPRPPETRRVRARCNSRPPVPATAPPRVHRLPRHPGEARRPRRRHRRQIRIPGVGFRPTDLDKRQPGLTGVTHDPSSRTTKPDSCIQSVSRASGRLDERALVAAGPVSFPPRPRIHSNPFRHRQRVTGGAGRAQPGELAAEHVGLARSVDGGAALVELRAVLLRCGDILHEAVGEAQDHRVRHPRVRPLATSMESRMRRAAVVVISAGTPASSLEPTRATSS